MPGEPRELEQRVEVLSRQVAELRARVHKLEGSQSEATPSSAEPLSAVEAIAVDAPLTIGSGSRALAFLGRTLVVLGGAYLLRATSDADVIPLAAGVAAGFAYAVWWLLACHRSARTDRVSATFHGIASVIIAFPLVFESTARFGVTSVSVGSMALLAHGAAALFVAARHRLVFLGWTVTSFFLGTALALVVATRDVVPVLCILLAAAAGLEVFAIDPPLRGLRWPVAIGVDLVAVLLWSLLVRAGGPPPNYAPISVGAAVTLLLLLPILYLTSIAARTLAFRRAVTGFGVVECILALLIGLGGAGILAAAGGSITLISIVALVLGAGCYSVSFSWLDRRSGRGRNFYFYATLALLLILTASSALLSGNSLATAYLTLALVGLGGAQPLPHHAHLPRNRVLGCRSPGGRHPRRRLAWLARKCRSALGGPVADGPLWTGRGRGLLREDGSEIGGDDFLLGRPRPSPVGRRARRMDRRGADGVLISVFCWPEPAEGRLTRASSPPCERGCSLATRWSSQPPGGNRGSGRSAGSSIRSC